MELIKGLLDGLKPIPKLQVSQWADKYRILTSESAAMPGRWKTSRTPFLREIMDSLSPTSPVNELVVMKGVQLGFTESGLNMVGCYIDVAPCPMMYVMPTIEMAKGISESRIDAMVENCDSLSKKIRPAKEKDSGNTKLKKEFPGGLLVLAGANSAASLRSRPVKILVLDEVDAYPLNVDNEGSPISLARKRTSTFGAQKKVYILSTPTVSGSSVIESEFEETEQRYYHVPCPHCGGMQHLKFDQLRWEAGIPETVKYECEHCGDLIEERSKPAFLEAGKWIPLFPERQKFAKRGYHINSLYSPLGWLSWAEIVAEWEKAQKDENLMRVFVNTILGETWKEMGEAPDWNAIYNRREGYAIGTVPGEVSVLTAGVDSQGDRLEVEVVGWVPGKRSYSICYQVIQGDTSGNMVWDELDKFLSQTFTRDDGAELPIRLACIDSGFRTQMTYNFVRRNTSRYIAVKGSDNLQSVASSAGQQDVISNGRKVGSLRLWRVGSSVVKVETYGWLRMNKNVDGSAPDGYCHFPEYGPDYFKGLTAEQLQYKIINGFTKSYWAKTFERNEPLDCRVYARAASFIVGIDRWKPERWKQEHNSYLKREGTAKKSTKRKQSDFW